MVVDLLIKNINVYNVYMKKFIKEDLTVLNERFFYVGNFHKGILKPKKIIDGNGKYLIPGLIDIHMHIESSMTTPFQFSQAVIPQGVTTIVADPHEIANVFGIDGIKAFMDSDKEIGLDIFYGIPSSVPSTSSKLETTGGIIRKEEATELLNYDKIQCLGEVMNFKDLIEDETSNINSIIEEIKVKRPYIPLEGHCPKIQGVDLAMYIYRGIHGDHTEQTKDSLKEKIKNGMFIEIQEKSLTQENIDFLMENNLYEHFCFVTDDVMADTLLNGHLNKLVKKAIKMGMKVENAIYAATYTPAKQMGFKDRGAISPGKIADFIILSDLFDFKIEKVYKKGKVLYDGHISYKDKKESFPNNFYNSVKLDNLINEDFKILAPIRNGKVKCRVIQVKNKTTFTEEKEVLIEVNNGILNWEKSSCCLIGVFERYGKNNGKAFGLVKGDIIKDGAIATTWAHDHHNLMVMGRNVQDMVIAANNIIKNSGGYCAVKDNKVLASIKLPIAGIISEERIDVLSYKLKNLRNAIKKLGYNHKNEIMSFSTLSLPVSPSIKITDKGLIRVKTQEILSMFCEN
ncbi:adenine deaminase C-terminal domain-containing protein [Clostridium rectalis]|uniref:adenine deaminase C-terminal domain-containing protein n=1 Tax=Clostridium rectalis TaxID=2040295 RepID=UPI000F62EC82|nr:adenine deaminase C-terminal domain-containing protein [Clostridium rectalis]